MIKYMKKEREEYEESQMYKEYLEAAERRRTPVPNRLKPMNR